jgi:hypothetical protein
MREVKSWLESGLMPVNGSAGRAVDEVDTRSESTLMPLKLNFDHRSRIMTFDGMNLFQADFPLQPTRASSDG